MDSISEGVQFLQNSQSFVATIATIVAMCILFKKEDNIIYKIHEDIFKQLKNDSNTKSLNICFTKLDSDSDYKLLTKCGPGDETIPKNVLVDVQNLLQEIGAWKYKMQFSDMQPKDDTIPANVVHQSCFYALLYILSAFLVDELFSAGCCIQFLRCISFFFFGITLLSYFYWTYKWIYFLYSMINFKSEKISVFGGGYKEILKILMIFSFISLPLVPILYSFDYIVDFIFLPNGLIWLKFLTLIFILLYGLIIPFSMPLFCRWIIGCIIRNYPKKKQDEVNKGCVEYLAKIKVLASKIPASNRYEV